jgi:hypothetical protein
MIETDKKALTYYEFERLERLELVPAEATHNASIACLVNYKSASLHQTNKTSPITKTNLTSKTNKTNKTGVMECMKIA